MPVPERLLNKICLVIYTDKYLNITKVNATFTHWFGIPAERVIGKSLMDLLSEFNNIDDLDGLFRDLGENETADATIKMVLVDTTNWIHLVGSAVKKDDNIIGFLLAGVKVDAEKQIQEIKQNNIIKETEWDLGLASQYLESILPSRTLFKRVFLGRGILMYFPMRGIGGDWYWYTVENKKMYLLLGDVVGHGISAGIITTALLTTLKNITKWSDFQTPKDIIAYLQEKLHRIFHMHTENRKDIEVSLSVSITLPQERYSSYISLNTPVYLIRNNEATPLHKYKQPLSLSEKGLLAHIQNHDIQFQENDWLWVFTDGAKDQYGDSQNKPFGTRRLIETLTKASSIGDVQQAEQFLLTKKAEWKGTSSQTDDITIFGVKL